MSTDVSGHQKTQNAVFTISSTKKYSRTRYKTVSVTSYLRCFKLQNSQTSVLFITFIQYSFSWFIGKLLNLNNSIKFIFTSKYLSTSNWVKSIEKNCNFSVKLPFNLVRCKSVILFQVYFLWFDLFTDALHRDADWNPLSFISLKLSRLMH